MFNSEYQIRNSSRYRVNEPSDKNSTHIRIQNHFEKGQK